MSTFRFPVDQHQRLRRMRKFHGVTRLWDCAPRMAMDCPTCGRPNADGKDFCECGEYLRWDPTGVFAVPVQAVGVAATPAVHQTSAPPTPVPTEPVVLTLRRPGAPPGEGPPQLQLAVATPGILQGVVRNQTGRVDSYELRIAGLPPGWVEITPPSVDLLPYGSSGQGHESHFHATITPPRSPDARAGRHSVSARGRLARQRRRDGHGARDARDPALPRADARGEAPPPQRPPPRALQRHAHGHRQRAAGGDAGSARPRGEPHGELRPAPAPPRADGAGDGEADREPEAPASVRPPARAPARAQRRSRRRRAPAAPDPDRPPARLDPDLAAAPRSPSSPRSPPPSCSPARRPRRCRRSPARRSTPPSSRPRAPASRRRPSSRRARPAAAARSAR